MKLKFIDQEYQTDAVNAIVDIFDGAKIKESIFTIDISNTKEYNPDFVETVEGMKYELGYANKLSLDDYELLANVRKIQERNKIKKSNDIHKRNFTIEMETGTGKTYVYTKTILELNKKYGFTKFIIVVPSIAIKEGVNKSFEITKDHFKTKYENVIYQYFVYDSSKLNQIKTFATSTEIQVMIINIDAFRKSFTDIDKESKANLIHRESEKLEGNKPIDLIASTNPIVIIDEPQSVDNTPKSKEAIKSLNPLFTLRYSATHKEVYNLMYRLTPVDAYQENLVKKIEVSSLKSDEISAKPYIKLISVSDKNGYSGKAEINYKSKDGSISKKEVTIKFGEDLWEKSNEVDYYKDNGYIVDDIDCFEDEQSITFINGIRLRKGEAIGIVDDDSIKRAQIRETIIRHLEKERHYSKKGIKVLSLFFIDRVDNYRIYDNQGNSQKGKYAIWFEEEYERLINGAYKDVREKNPNLIFDKERVHDGYFSVDKKNNIRDTKGDSAADESTYELIMKDKEKLLSQEEPLRFIFSHSALKEGWDNPNVFQVCTLIESKDTFTKRQKIGRGLRICVNQQGERVGESKYNVLTIIANESYKDFASTLQKELETEAGYKFGIVEDISFAGLDYESIYGQTTVLSQENSAEIFNYLKQNKYIKSNGKVEDKFFKDVNKNTFLLPAKYQNFQTKIIDAIFQLSKTIEIKDTEGKVPVKLNKQVYLSDTFKELWNKIKYKTLYSVNMNIDKLIEDSIIKIKEMPKIESERIHREISRLDIVSSGVVREESVRYANLGSLNEYEDIHYPDVIRRLQDATGLLRRTIIKILKESGRIDDFYTNPETFIRTVSSILNHVKKINLSEGLQYHKSDEYYVQQEIFDDTELYGYRDLNILDISDEKNVFDHVIFDSVIEKQFAIDAEADEDVILYAKLPSKFKIETPFGGYNPDWAVVLQTSNSEHKLYFIAETKGSEDELSRRIDENNKILCGRKHFEVVDNDIKYEVIKEFRKLKEVYK